MRTGVWQLRTKSRVTVKTKSGSVRYILVRNLSTISMASEVQAAARSMGQGVYILKADTSDQIDEAFAAFGRERVDALFVGPDPFFNSRRLQFALMAVRHMIPAIYGNREYVEAGGLMSYGPNLVDVFREV